MYGVALQPHLFLRGGFGARVDFFVLYHLGFRKPPDRSKDSCKELVCKTEGP